MLKVTNSLRVNAMQVIVAQTPLVMWVLEQVEGGTILVQ